MILDHLNESVYARQLEKAVRGVLEDNAVTPDLGGQLTTSQVGDRIVDAI